MSAKKKKGRNRPLPDSIVFRSNSSLSNSGLNGTSLASSSNHSVAISSVFTNSNFARYIICSYTMKAMPGNYTVNIGKCTISCIVFSIDQSRAIEKIEQLERQQPAIVTTLTETISILPIYAKSSLSVCVQISFSIVFARST